MSEPGAGSDVVSMKLRADRRGEPLRAERHEDVDHQRPLRRNDRGLCKTDPSAGPKGITAFIVERDFKGFRRRAEARQAWHARLANQRTRVRGLRGSGRKRPRRPGRRASLMSGLDYERAVLAAGPLGSCRRASISSSLTSMNASSSASRSGSSSLSRRSWRTCTPRSAHAVPMSTPWRAPATRARRPARMPPARSFSPRRPPPRPRSTRFNPWRQRLHQRQRHRAASARCELYEIGAGTSEIRRMLIGRELFRETA